MTSEEIKIPKYGVKEKLTIEQFEDWRAYVGERFWPEIDRYKQESWQIMDKVNSLINSGTLSMEKTRMAKQKVYEVAARFRDFIKQEGGTFGNKFGPVLSIVGPLLSHDLGKFFSDSLPARISLIEDSIKKNEQPQKLTLEEFNFMAKERLIQRGVLLKIPESLLDQYKEDTRNDLTNGSRGSFTLGWHIGLIWEKLKTDMPDELVKNIQFKVEIPEEMTDIWLYYEQFVVLILKELVRNAIYALNSTAGSIEVSIGKEANNFVLRVKDTGPGMSEATARRLFIKGFTTRETGTGAGLHFIKEALEKIFGGSIEVETKFGLGTTFTITLPAPEQ